jgi:YD repeat-containing protein
MRISISSGFTMWMRRGSLPYKQRETRILIMMVSPLSTKSKPSGPIHSIKRAQATVQSGDGLTNQEKSELGLNPKLNYSDAAAVQPAKFNYDLVGRLTGVTAPVGAETFTPDEEGNLTNAQ